METENTELLFEKDNKDEIIEVCPYCWNPNIMLEECTMCGAYFEKNLLPKELLDEIHKLPWINSYSFHVVEAKEQDNQRYKEKITKIKKMLKSLFKNS